MLECEVEAGAGPELVVRALLLDGPGGLTAVSAVAVKLPVALDPEMLAVLLVLKVNPGTVVHALDHASARRYHLVPSPAAPLDHHGLLHGHLRPHHHRRLHHHLRLAHHHLRLAHHRLLAIRWCRGVSWLRWVAWGSGVSRLWRWVALLLRRVAWLLLWWVTWLLLRRVAGLRWVLL